jgi:KDO2-lipid IV(A) lauroyltransferase
MDGKELRKACGRFFGWLGLESCSLIIRFLPASWLYGFARAIAALGYRFALKQRRIALEGLELAFGQEKTCWEREQIAKDCFLNIAKGAVELIFLMQRPKLLRKRVSLAGRENLDVVLSKGRGVILVSGHFGNFPLLLAKLSLEGYPTAGIMRFMRDERVEKIFAEKRRRLGIKTIYSQPRKACVEESIRTLRQNGLLFIPLDQNFGTAGVFVNFFGRQAATATGPVVLAQRTGAGLVVCFIVRQPDDTQRIIFEPQIELDPTEATAVNIQRLTGIIESYIRQYPAEWGWIHRRWKTKPS